MMIDYQVQLINFPDSKTRETVTPNIDGSYTIFIETSLSKKRAAGSFYTCYETYFR